MRFGIGLLSLALLPFFDNDGGAGGGAPGAPTGGNPGATPPASPTSGTPSGTPGQAPASTPPGSGTPSGAAPKKYEYQEDRSNWVPSHVIRERTQKEAERRAQLERDLHYERQRVAALSGVQMPKPPANPEHEQMRNLLFEIVPGLKNLEGLDFDKLSKVTGFDFDALQKANQETTNRVWENHGVTARRTFEAKVKDLYGDLEPKQLSRMINAFAAEANDDPQMTRRYELGDFTVFDEWLADWSKGFIDPIRKQASTPTPGQVAARRLPRSGGGGAAVSQRPPSLTPKDGDKFHNAAFEAFERSRSGR